MRKYLPKCPCSVFYLDYTSAVLVVPVSTIAQLKHQCKVGGSNTLHWRLVLRLLETRKLVDILQEAQVRENDKTLTNWNFASFCDVTIPSHLVLEGGGGAGEFSMKPWLRGDTGPKLVWHPQPLMNGTALSALWAPVLGLKKKEKKKSQCFWTGAEPKQTREHQPRPTPDGYTLNAPVVRNNPLCHSPPPAAPQHGAHTQYAVAQDGAGNTRLEARRGAHNRRRASSQKHSQRN